MKALVDAFTAQGVSCENLGSPFMARLFRQLARDWQGTGKLGAKCATFKGPLGPAGASLPLRIAGGLHALVLQSSDPALAAVYPPNAPDGTVFRDTLLSALDRHDAFLAEWIDSPPQTNEIRRSAALIPGAHVAVSHFELPVHLSEMGASGGLNLMWDTFGLRIGDNHIGPSDPTLTLFPDWAGALPPATRPVIVDRRGVDLMPLDPQNPQHLLRLQAFLWPDQPHRLDMTRAAARIASGIVDQGDAVDWLENRLDSVPDGRLHLIQNTVAWQYFPSAAQARGQQLIEAAGLRATPERPLGWLQLETDGDENGLGGAALTLRLWPGDLFLSLGRADFHGRWVHWAGD